MTEQENEGMLFETLGFLLDQIERRRAEIEKELKKLDKFRKLLQKRGRQYSDKVKK